MKVPINTEGPQINKPTTFHILVVEDDTKEIELLSDLLREVADCKIDVMSQGQDFLDWVDRSNYHLVIVAESSLGLTLLEQIKRLTPGTSVILISEKATIEEAVAAIRLGAEDYLGKPFDRDAFQLAVKRGLDRKAVFGQDEGASNFLHLLNSCQLISASLEQKKIFEVVQSYLCRELKAGYSAIYSIRDDEPTRVGSHEKSESYDKTLEEVLQIALSASNSIASMSNPMEFYRFIDRGHLTPAIFLFRFHCGGGHEFFCACLSPEPPASLDAFESRLRLLKAQIEVTGKNIEHYNGVQQLAFVDDATGLYNTRYLNYILDREIGQNGISHKSFAVLFIDADKFKVVNDIHGHLVGTKLLNELGHHLKKFVRETDTVFRYGGDEFVAILSPCDLTTARTVAERIRESVEKKSFLENEGLAVRFTVSIGVALFPNHAGTKKEIIEAADQAMYTAKKTTRNSVSITASPKLAEAQKKVLRGR